MIIEIEIEIEIEIYFIQRTKSLYKFAEEYGLGQGLASPLKSDL